MIRIIMIMVLALSLVGQAKSQSMYGDLAKADVKMKYVYSLEEALNLAKKENKLVFFNCFADWATPCHSMNQLVFSDKDFADYMNNNFINLILDLSHRENIPIKEKYKVRFFAHYLVLDADGQVVHRIAGGAPLPDFKDKIVRSLNSKTSLLGMEMEYAKGNRNVPFLSEYYKVLSDAGYSEVADEVRDVYVSKIPKADMAKAENWKMFTSMVEDVESEWFAYLKKNKSAFIKYNGEKKVKDYAALLYMRAVMPFMSSTVGYSPDKMASYMNDAKYFELEPENNFYIYHTLASKRNQGNLADYVSYLEKNIATIHPTFAVGVDLSLKNIVNVTADEQKVITEYLTRRMSDMQGSSLEQYQTAIKEIKRENGIIFEQGEFAETLKKAKAENKLIFFDAYTTWCGPCKIMAQQVFTQDLIGEYFNKTFVNYKMDMESGEGPKWAKDFKISAYPTFLLVNGDGELVHKIVGAHPPKEFVDLINKGLNPETAYANVKNQYDMGNRDAKLVANYLDAMKITGEVRDIDIFLEKYYAALTPDQKSPEKIWPLIERYSADINNKYWNAIINDKSAIGKLMTDSSFINKVESVYGLHIYNAIAKNEKGEQYEKAKKDLSNFSLADNSLLSNLLIVDQLKMKANYAEIVDFYLKNVADMKDLKGKTNMDLLWKYMIASCTDDQKKEVLSYLKEQHASAGPRAVNSYKNLLDAVM